MRMHDREDFIGHGLVVCENLSVFPGIHTVLMTDDDDSPGVATMPVASSMPDPAAVDQFFAGHHDYAGMATLVSWSPDERPFGPTWLFVAVRRDQTAAFVLGRVDLQQWWQLMPEQMPWFALSTAGSLRGVLDGEPMPPVKVASDGDPTLFGIAASGAPAPPMDDRGRI